MPSEERVPPSQRMKKTDEALTRLAEGAVNRDAEAAA